MLRAESVVSRDQDVVPCWILASSSQDLVGASDSFFCCLQHRGGNHYCRRDYCLSEAV